MDQIEEEPVYRLRSRCMLLPITLELLEEIDDATPTRAYLLPAQLPDDVEICGMFFNSWLHHFDIKLRSHHFAPVREGEVYPAIRVEFAKQDNASLPPCPFLTKLVTFLRDAKASLGIPGSKITLEDVVIWPASYTQGKENR